MLKRKRNKSRREKKKKKRTIQINSVEILAKSNRTPDKGELPREARTMDVVDQRGKTPEMVSV